MFSEFILAIVRTCPMLEELHMSVFLFSPVTFSGQLPMSLRTLKLAFLELDLAAFDGCHLPELRILALRCCGPWAELHCEELRSRCPELKAEACEVQGAMDFGAKAR